MVRWHRVTIAASLLACTLLIYWFSSREPSETPSLLLRIANDRISSFRILKDDILFCTLGGELHLVKPDGAAARLGGGIDMLAYQIAVDRGAAIVVDSHGKIYHVTNAHQIREDAGLSLSPQGLYKRIASSSTCSFWLAEQDLIHVRTLQHGIVAKHEIRITNAPFGWHYINDVAACGDSIVVLTPAGVFLTHLSKGGGWERVAPEQLSFGGRSCTYHDRLIAMSTGDRTYCVLEIEKNGLRIVRTGHLPEHIGDLAYSENGDLYVACAYALNMDGRVYRIRHDGGEPELVCRMKNESISALEVRGQEMVFSTGSGALFRMPIK